MATGSAIPLMAFTPKPTITAGKYPPSMAVSTVPRQSRKSGMPKKIASFAGTTFKSKPKTISSRAFLERHRKPLTTFRIHFRLDTTSKAYFLIPKFFLFTYLKYIKIRQKESPVSKN